MEHKTQTTEHKTKNTGNVPYPVFRVQSQHGFALLFAIIASSLLLSIGLAIWGLSFREVVISSFGRESQSAFYVADSAIECTLYYDFIKTNFFATSTDSFTAPPVYDNYKTIDCGGSSQASISIYDPPVSSYEIDGRNATTTFTVNFGAGRAIVYVGKSDPDGDGRSATNVVSHGQNSLNASDPTLVERGLKTNY